MEHLELVTSLQPASEKISLSEMKYEVEIIFFKAKALLSIMTGHVLKN